MITVQNLNKFYQKTHAVRGISFEIQDGELFALLGTNGAGKTTTISCMTSLLDFDSGEIRINGYDVRTEGEAVRKQIGVVFQESLLDAQLTARENLLLWSRIARLDLRELEHIMEITGVSEFQNRKYHLLSGGEKRRVDFARAILSHPQVLFLDEPTAGLDPQSRRQIWDIVHQLRRTYSMTVVLTTHYMEETENADHLILIKNGVTVAEGTPLELKSRYTQPKLILQIPEQKKERVRRELLDQFQLDSREQSGNLELRLQSARDALPLLQHFEADIQDLELLHGSMDEVFLHLIHEAQEERK